MLKVGVVSLGCSKNRIDSEVMMSYLLQDGYTFTADPAEADIIIVNTCGFIESAKEESIDSILEMAQFKQEGACSTLVVTGCLSQRYREELQGELPEVDIILGVSEYEQLPVLLDERYIDKKQRQDKLRYDRIITTPSHYAYMRIAEGCNHHCSFCAIPAIRGQYQSRTMEELVDEAKMLRERGVNELILIAQDTSRYGMDLYGENKLIDLLKKLSAIDFQGIRLLYSYPEDISDELLDLMDEENNIIPYLDMPVQHVDDHLLKRMNRKGDQAYLIDLIKKIRAKKNPFTIRTTFIVGFPGETEEEFETLCSFIQEYPLDRMGVFTYSPEEGTPAAKMPDQIATETAEARRDQLMTIQQGISQSLLKQRIGTTCQMVIEGWDEDNSCYIGRSAAEAPDIDGIIFLPNEAERTLAIGSYIDVEIIGAQEYDLIGRKK